MFVKWSCGCVGIRTNGQKWVIEPCDGDAYSNGLMLRRRDEGLMESRRDALGHEMQNVEDDVEYRHLRKARDAMPKESLEESVEKKFNELPAEEVEYLLRSIGDLMNDGYKFATIKRCLS